MEHHTGAGNSRLGPFTWTTDVFQCGGEVYEHDQKSWEDPPTSSEVWRDMGPITPGGARGEPTLETIQAAVDAALAKGAPPLSNEDAAALQAAMAREPYLPTFDVTPNGVLDRTDRAFVLHGELYLEKTLNFRLPQSTFFDCGPAPKS